MGFTARIQTSLKTKDKKDAERLYQAHCECAEAPDRAYRVGMAYVGSIDPDAATRTWKHVIEAYAANHPKGFTTRYRIGKGVRKGKEKGSVLDIDT